MHLEAFSTEQADRLLELLVLGMYADGHLADAEDQTLKYLAEQAGLRPGYNVEQALDRAIGKARGVQPDDAGLRAAVVGIAKVIDERDVREVALESLAAIHRSDADDAPAENRFIQIVQEVFEL